jgi:arylamine N-acetyltransferase
MENTTHIKKTLSVQAYLDRINYAGNLDTNIENLTALQETHINNVPYENLDIVAGTSFSLAPECIYEKVVERRRGGYCFELNGLFNWLLTELGYKPIEFFGRWLKLETLDIPPRRHRISKVMLDGKAYICDAGVGMPAPQWPLLFEEGLEQEVKGETYRIVKNDNLGWVVEEYYKGEWGRLYSFTEEPQHPVDYFMPHYYCTTHPDSIFLNNTMVFIRTPEGRNTVADVLDPVTGEKMVEFRIFKGEDVEAFIPRSEGEYKDALKQYFGIVI